MNADRMLNILYRSRQLAQAARTMAALEGQVKIAGHTWRLQELRKLHEDLDLFDSELRTRVGGRRP